MRSKSLLGLWFFRGPGVFCRQQNERKSLGLLVQIRSANKTK